jgi:uncharacterized protein YbaA (DUF1428 family)
MARYVDGFVLSVPKKKRMVYGGFTVLVEA